MGEIIVITSGKGGVGKTTTTANIGTGLAKLGKKVLVIDTDLGLRNLDVVMGLENRIVYNLVDVIEGKCRLKQAAIHDKRYEGLYLLPSAQTKDKSAISPEQMKKLTAELKEDYDFVLLDCPAGIEQGFENAVAGADRAVVVTTPEVSAIRDADRIIGLLESKQIRNLELVINRIRIDMVKRGDMMSLYLLPSAQTKDKSAISPEQMKKLTAELKEDYDFVLLDCPAGIEQGFENAVAGADRAVVVTTPEVSAIRDADRIIGLLESKQIRNLELVINRIRIDMVKRGDMMSVEDVTEILPIHLLGAIPDDEQVVIATNQGEPVVGDDSPSGRAYMNICRRLCGEEVPLMDMNTKVGLFSRLSHLFKKN